MPLESGFPKSVPHDVLQMPWLSVGDLGGGDTGTAAPWTVVGLPLWQLLLQLCPLFIGSCSSRTQDPVSPRT